MLTEAELRDHRETTSSRGVLVAHYEQSGIHAKWKVKEFYDSGAQAAGRPRPG